MGWLFFLLWLKRLCYYQRMTNSIKLSKLRKFNLKMAALHAVQGAAVLILANNFSLPITTNYLSFDEATEKLTSAQQNLFTIRFAWLIAAFLFVSAIAHLTIATVYNKKYNSNLEKGLNKARWFEYSISASIMMVAIAMLFGIYDISSLLMIFGLVAIMNLMGLVMEVHNQSTTKTSWLSYYIGCLAGIIPWIAIGIYFWAGINNGSGPPTFVYGIFFTLFLMFNSFAINMILQYKKVGKWKDYLYGERVYIILSLVAKSLLAWQVFGGTLRPN